MGGELAEDAGLVEGVVVAPELLALLDPLLGGEAGDAGLAGEEVGGVEGGHGDGFVDLLFLVEGAAEGAGCGGGVADEEELGVGGGHDGFDGFVDGFGDAFGFVDDEEDVGGVEALELVGGVGGEAEGVAVGGEFPAGVVELAAEGLGVAAC